jgi:transcriptional regulator with XRE-family HTH domain
VITTAGKITAVGRRSVPAGQRLRDLLKAGRRASGNLSQKTAAERAGISLIYWQRIESGRIAAAPPGTLAVMCQATGVTAQRLRDEGYPAVADALRDLDAAAGVTAEDHLAATPGASAEEIGVLKAVWAALKARRTTDPLEADFDQNSRHSSNTDQTGQ